MQLQQSRPETSQAGPGRVPLVMIPGVTGAGRWRPAPTMSELHRRPRPRVPPRLLQNYAVSDSAPDFAVRPVRYRSGRDSGPLSETSVEEKAVWQFFWSHIAEE